MPNVVNVRFRGHGKAYFFDANGLEPKVGDAVVVETSKGLELGDCVEGIHEIAETSVVAPLRPVVRIATKDDIHVAEMNRLREKTAFSICEDKIRNHGLDMKLVDVEYAFEGGKILFFFTSDGRVDFRELVKDLAGVFHTRIELRQIGVRDGAKMLGGLGICGRPFCCATFLDEFQPVSIRMAKTQNLSLNPTKISGTCGRLMCCLKYEQEAYEDLVKSMPRVEAPVDTPKGKGTVTEVNLLRRSVKVKLDDGGDAALQSYSVDQLGYTLNGEYIAPLPEAEKPPKPAVPDLSRYFAENPEDSGENRRDRGEFRRGRNGKNREARELKEPREPREPKEPKNAKPNEQREKPKPDGERKKGEGKPYRGAKPHFQNGKGETRPPKEGKSEQPRPPREGKPEQPRPPKDGKPGQSRPPRDAAATGETAPKPEKKGGSFHKHRYYNRDKKKPGSGDSANG